MQWYFQDKLISEDRIFVISSVKPHHQGTYECRSYSGFKEVFRAVGTLIVQSKITNITF